MKKKISSEIKAQGIQYSGNVKITLKKGDVVLKSETYHNTCTLDMLDLLCLALIGQHTDRGAEYMGIGTNNTTDSSLWNIANHSLVSEKVGCRVKTNIGSTYTKLINKKAVGKQAVVSATFPYSLIASTSIGELGLFKSKENADLLARVVFPQPVVIGEEDKGISLTVDWIVSVVNDTANNGEV